MLCSWRLKKNQEDESGSASKRNIITFYDYNLSRDFTKEFVYQFASRRSKIRDMVLRLQVKFHPYLEEQLQLICQWLILVFKRTIFRQRFKRRSSRVN